MSRSPRLQRGASPARPLQGHQARPAGRTARGARRGWSGVHRGGDGLDPVPSGVVPSFLFVLCRPGRRSQELPRRSVLHPPRGGDLVRLAAVRLLSGAR
eukprot:2573349-Prymnesium_polylepis.1